MKHQLETIAVTDAWSSPTPCPLCSLMDAAEKRHIAYYLGNSVMNPETRVEVNEVGFCNRHFPMMRDAGKAHHLGLIAHTHLQTLRGKIAKNIREMSRKGSGRAAAIFTADIAEMTCRCLVCRSLERDSQRYAYTVVSLHSREEGFRRLFLESDGPCLPHAADLVSTALDSLGKNERQKFLASLSQHLDEKLRVLEDEVLHFTQKFDAQNDNLDWGNSRDAQARVVQAICGRKVRLDS